jgi:hypothetical protein
MPPRRDLRNALDRPSGRRPLGRAAPHRGAGNGRSVNDVQRSAGTRASPHLGRRAMRASRRSTRWVNVVWIAAAALSTAVTALFQFVLGFGWYALAAGPPTFLAVSVLVPFFLGVRDRREGIAEPRDQRPRGVVSRGRRQPADSRRSIKFKPAPDVAHATKALTAESAGRTPSEHSPQPLIGQMASGASGSSAAPPVIA